MESDFKSDDLTARPQLLAADCTLKRAGWSPVVSIRYVVQIIWGESFGGGLSMHEYNVTLGNVKSGVVYKTPLLLRTSRAKLTENESEIMNN